MSITSVCRAKKRLSALPLKVCALLAALCAALWLCPPKAAAEGELAPFDMTGQCRLTANEGDPALVTDGRLRTFWQARDGLLRVRLPDAPAAGYLQLEWFKEPEHYRIIQKDREGAELCSFEPGGTAVMLTEVFPIEAGARQIDIQTGGAISTLAIYTAQTPRAALRLWQPPPEKATLMLVSAHQDDEFLCMGGVLPLYAVEKEVPTAVIYMADCGRTRRGEALEGLWAIGMRNYPLFLNFPDKRLKTMEECAALWGEGATLEKLVEAIRRFRPEVVVTHDLSGEYGHCAHKFTAYAVRLAVARAADPAAYPLSAAAYGSWQVKKLYLHLYKQNPIRLDYSQKLARCGDKSAFEAAAAGYARHASQQKYYQFEEGGPHDNALFGLAFSMVGEDVQKNDLLENIAPSPTPMPPAGGAQIELPAAEASPLEKTAPPKEAAPHPARASALIACGLLALAALLYAARPRAK